MWVPEQVLEKLQRRWFEEQAVKARELRKREEEAEAAKSEEQILKAKEAAEKAKAKAEAEKKKQEDEAEHWRVLNDPELQANPGFGEPPSFSPHLSPSLLWSPQSLLSSPLYSSPVQSIPFLDHSTPLHSSPPLLSSETPGPLLSSPSSLAKVLNAKLSVI